MFSFSSGLNHISKVKLNDYNKALSGRQPTISNNGTVAAPNDTVARKIERHCSKKIELHCSRKSGVTVTAIMKQSYGNRYEEDEFCTSIDRQPAGVARQSITNIDRHLTVLIDTHINGITSTTSMDCHFIVSIDIDISEQITLKIPKWINLSTMLHLLRMFQGTKADLQPNGAQLCLSWGLVYMGSDYSKKIWKRFELALQFHRFEVNQHPITEVMPVLLKSGQSASREEAIEEKKDCRSTVHPCHRSTPSIDGDARPWAKHYFKTD
ncbi:hypothetical protein DY000_02040265 [Brassica cretica]|uniref:DUF4283 domain-containing protein n=1 Tax=Brassica cretica TaxID=69181 RepID=A0ABQ7BFZ7_BRACR|nr:hypothetical protein DY000_02040265 [Brassica cretica]